MMVCFVCAAEVYPFEIEGVPFLEQEKQQCGPSALATVLSYYGSPVRSETISRSVYLERIKGSLITDLENYARGLGFRAESGRGSVKEVQNMIVRGRPVIVLVDLGTWIVSRPHYLVVFGYDEEGFIVHDGRRAARPVAYPEFREAWEKMGRPFLLVTP